MAKIKIDDILDHLDYELRRALEDAVLEIIPNARFDPHQLYRAFTRAAYRKCSTWESVPDRYVDK